MDINVLREIAYKLLANRKSHLEREKVFIYVSHEIFDDKVSFIHSFIDRFSREAEGELCIKI